MSHTAVYILVITFSIHVSDTLRTGLINKPPRTYRSYQVSWKSVWNGENIQTHTHTHTHKHISTHIHRAF